MVPILLITGFLGAGKTTLINRLLRTAEGRKIAAIVNDFGALNIDATLLAGAGASELIGLENGCICCALQGDLLRALRLVMEAEPDLIVIEASGAADPRGVLEVLSDPALTPFVRCDVVACVLDAEALIADPARLQDPLWAAQLAQSDFALVSKAELPLPLQVQLAPWGKALIRIETGALELLLARGAPDRPGPLGPKVSASHLESLTWTSPDPLDPARFSATLSAIAPALLRAKGWLRFAGDAQSLHLLQLAGRRATLSPAGSGAPRDLPGAHLVLIGAREGFNAAALAGALDQCRRIG